MIRKCEDACFCFLDASPSEGVRSSSRNPQGLPWILLALLPLVGTGYDSLKPCRPVMSRLPSAQGRSSLSICAPNGLAWRDRHILHMSFAKAVGIARFARFCSCSEQLKLQTTGPAICKGANNNCKQLDLCLWNGLCTVTRM